MAEEPVTKKGRASRSSRLPQAPIDKALPIARALQELAGPSTPHRIAQRLGVSPTAGAFRTVLGAAGYYGLIRQEGDRRALTDLGQRAVADGEDGLLARQQAVARTGFRSILTTFRGREANEGVIAARLQDDFAVPAAGSAQIAKALVEACSQVQLIANGRFDAEAIENALAAAPSEANAPAPDHREHAGTRPAPAKPVSRIASTEPRTADGQAHTPPVQIRSSEPTVHIDIQLHIPATATAEQIDQIFASMAKHLYGRE